MVPGKILEIFSTVYHSIYWVSRPYIFYRITYNSCISQDLIENSPSGGNTSNSCKPPEGDRDEIISSNVHSKFFLMCLTMLSCSQSPSSVSMLLNNGLLGLSETVSRLLGQYKWVYLNRCDYEVIYLEIIRLKCDLNCTLITTRRIKYDKLKSVNCPTTTTTTTNLLPLLTPYNQDEEQ